LKKNKAAVWKKNELIIVEEKNYPILTPNNVIVRIKYVGLCGSDLHFFQDGRIGSGILTEPRILGHEASGYIEEVGKDVTNLKEGDPVVIDPGLSCGICKYCQTGRYNLCNQAAWDFLGTSHKDGALQNYLAYPAGRVYKISNTVTLKTAALLEPYSVASHGVLRMGIIYGGFTVVIGCGCIGLMCVNSIKQRFNTKVIAVDIIDKRLKKARMTGADFIINSTTENLIEKVLEFTDGNGADYIFETAGMPYTIELTADLARKGGKIVFVGTAVDTHVKMNFNAIMRKELDMHTVFRFAGEMKMAVDEMEREPFSLEQIITHQYDFEEVQKAFENNIYNKNDVVKTIICI
jgi:L-iditol 2-dehydrogenase